MNLEQLDNLCYSLEMLNKTVERGCNECSSLKTHQSYRNKHTSRDIDYQRHAFCVNFWSVMKLALIFYTALVDLVATAVVWQKKKFLLWGVMSAASGITVKHFSSLFHSLMKSKHWQRTVVFLQSGLTLSLRSTTLKPTMLNSRM